MGRNINPQNGAKMNMILFENPPTVYFERIEDYEEKSTPWRRDIKVRPLKVGATRNK